MKNKLIFLIIFLILLFVQIGNTEDINYTGKDLKCPSVNPITTVFKDLCWGCIFPIYLGSVKLFDESSSFKEQDWNNQKEFKNPKELFCHCSSDLTKIGLIWSFWSPTRLIEVVRKRGCLMFMLGAQLPSESLDNAISNITGINMKYAHGSLGKAGGSETSEVFAYNVHYYSFPVFEIFKLLSAPECSPGGYIDLGQLFMSETSPYFENDQLTLFNSPEAILFANPLSIMACSTDAFATIKGFGLNYLFWCDGSNGIIYPLTKYIGYSVSPVREAFHLVSKTLAYLHRIGRAWKTIGKNAICGSKIYPFLIKNQYRVQIVYPVAKTKGKCCIPLGRNTILADWERRHIPATGEDYGFIIYHKINCCIWKNLLDELPF